MEAKKMTIQERLDAIKKEYAELEEQIRNITQHMLRLEGAFRILTELSQELEEEVVAEEVSVEEVE
jgi:predicted nuclease with TOPRIM domain